MKTQKEYMRSQIANLFGQDFNPGNWNAGIVKVGDDLVLLVTLNKTRSQLGGKYDDRFIDASTFHWQSQTRTTLASSAGQILTGQAPGKVHLFVREHKLRGGRACPFTYIGQPKCLAHEGEKPISITWGLRNALTPRLCEKFNLGSGE